MASSVEPELKEGQGLSGLGIVRRRCRLRSNTADSRRATPPAVAWRASATRRSDPVAGAVSVGRVFRPMEAFIRGVHGAEPKSTPRAPSWLLPSYADANCLMSRACTPCSNRENRSSQLAELATKPRYRCRTGAGLFGLPTWYCAVVVFSRPKRELLARGQRP